MSENHWKDRLVAAGFFSIAATVFWLLAAGFNLYKPILVQTDYRFFGLISVFSSVVVATSLTPFYLRQFRKGHKGLWGIVAGISITIVAAMLAGMLAAFYLGVKDGAGQTWPLRLISALPLALIFAVYGLISGALPALPLGAVAGHLLWRYHLIKGGK